MQKGQGGAKLRLSGRWTRGLAAARPWCALACSAGIFCGCATHAQNQNAASSDPLLGGNPANRAPSRAPTPVAAVPPAPAPAVGSLTSNAALAAGPAKPLDNANDLRIAEPPRNPDSRYGQGKDWSGSAPPQPGPVAEPVARAPVPLPAAPVPSAGARVLSFEQAMQQLVAHGVTWYELKTWGDGGEVKFSCSVPVPQRANISRNYEARARNYLEAMQAVIAQIDQERR